MNMNWLLVPTLILAFSLFFCGRLLWLRTTTSYSKTIFFSVSLVLAAPAVLFVIYYFHWFDNAAWFYQYRSFNLSELTAAGAGALAGIISAAVNNRRSVSAPFLLILLSLGIFIPHSKSVLFPANYSSLENNCVNGFCLQSSNSTCGPASAVTVLNHFGIEATEQELARECYSYIGGTEIWYIARVLRKRGLDCRFVILEHTDYELPRPSIAGINMGAGHFITIIDEQEGDYIIGDPLIGRKRIKKEEVFDRINFTGFFLVIKNRV